MKKNATFLLSKESLKVLEAHAEATHRKKSQLVERAILRCYGTKVKP